MQTNIFCVDCRFNILFFIKPVDYIVTWRITDVCAAFTNIQYIFILINSQKLVASIIIITIFKLDISLQNS